MHRNHALVLGMFALLLAATSACSDLIGVGKTPATGLHALIVSSPMPGAASAAGASAGASVVGPVVYVSLPPGTVPDGLSATIQDQATGVVITIALVAGGFDPVAVTANVGDTLTVVITRAGSAASITSYQVVSLGQPLRVVRTSPPKGKADVPINAPLVVVFSAPIDPATLNTSSVQLLRGSTPVAGTVRLSDATGVRAEFQSDNLYAKLTPYQLVVSQAIRDVNGLALESLVTVPFTTGSADPASNLVFSTVSAGDFHSCGLDLSGAAYCWGENDHGALGDGTTANSATPVAVTGGLIFAALSAGNEYTCGVTTTGALYCWGGSAASMFVGTLGSSPVPYAPGLTFKAVSAGPEHVCAVTTAGAADCWGYDETGQLGFGTQPGGGAVAGGLTFASVAAGGQSTCGVTTTGAAYCWGDNYSGELGTGSTTGPGQCFHTRGPSNPFTPDSSPCSRVPVAVAGGLMFVQVEVGEGSACGLTPNGDAYCWGYNNGGELGNGTTTGPDLCYSSLSCAASPVAVAGGLTFTALSVAAYHACGLTSAGAAYCWGANGDGQLGDGTTTSSAVPVPVAWGLTFATVSADVYHTCGVTTRGVAYCWGANMYGSLGDGTNTNSTRPKKVAGQP